MRTKLIATVLAAAFSTGGAALSGDAPAPAPAAAPAGPPVELYPVVQEGKWGFMDKAGKVAVKPEYDCAWDFSEGLACVQVGIKRGYIDPSGKMVVKPEYGLARPFSDGLAAVLVGAGTFGKDTLDASGGHWAFIDKTGKVVIDPPNTKLSVVDDFHDGEARVKFVFNVHLRSSWINAKGNIRQFASKPVGRFSEGLAASPDKGGYGFIDHAGKFVVPGQFEDAGYFSDGLARVRKDKKWGFVDKEGKPAFEAKFDDAREFSEGLAAVAADQAPPPADPKKPNKPILKWGCVDKAGKVVAEPKYDFVGPCRDGMMRIVLGDKHGYMDKTGKVVVEPKFTVAWDFSRGLARVEIETPTAGPGLGKQGYIDKTGNFVWQPSK